MTTNRWWYCWSGKSHARKSVLCDGVSTKRCRIPTPRPWADIQENLRGPDHHKFNCLRMRTSGIEIAQRTTAPKANSVMRRLQCEDVSSYFSCLFRAWHDSGSMVQSYMT